MLRGGGTWVMESAMGTKTNTAKRTKREVGKDEKKSGWGSPRYTLGAGKRSHRVM